MLTCGPKRQKERRSALNNTLKHVPYKLQAKLNEVKWRN